MSKPKIKISNLNLFYGEKQALYDVNLDIGGNEVTALIGPSGSVPGAISATTRSPSISTSAVTRPVGLTTVPPRIRVVVMAP